jgi:hypothetical protein
MSLFRGNEKQNSFRVFFFILVCEVIGTAATPGLLCQPRVIVKMIVEKQKECRFAGETEVLGENLPQRHFCPSQSRVFSIGLEYGSNTRQCSSRYYNVARYRKITSRLRDVCCIQSHKLHFYRWFHRNIFRSLNVIIEHVYAKLYKKKTQICGDYRYINMATDRYEAYSDHVQTYMPKKQHYKITSRLLLSSSSSSCLFCKVVFTELVRFIACVLSEIVTSRAVTCKSGSV